MVSGSSPTEEFGPYIVYEQLGVGGMAQVHRAISANPAFPNQVALKRMLSHLTGSEEMVKSFVREAKLASYLKHENVARTYDLGRVGEIYFIAMELISGRNLREVLRHCGSTTGPMPVPIALNILNQICDALDYAHNLCDERGRPLGIVHRDVSPSNVIVSSHSGTVKLIDFGIAKASGAGMQTMSGTLKGKFAYMAPEYIAGRIDARADLFAVGVIAHELLTNRPLFSGRDDIDTLSRVREMPIDPPSRKNPQVPAEIDDIVMTALARDPDRRWQHATALRSALTTLTHRLGLVASNTEMVAWLDWAFTLKRGSGRPSEHDTETDGVVIPPDDEPSISIEQLTAPQGPPQASRASLLSSGAPESLHDPIYPPINTPVGTPAYFQAPPRAPSQGSRGSGTPSGRRADGSSPDHAAPKPAPSERRSARHTVPERPSADRSARHARPEEHSGRYPVAEPAPSDRSTRHARPERPVEDRSGRSAAAPSPGDRSGRHAVLVPRVNTHDDVAPGRASGNLPMRVPSSSAAPPVDQPRAASPGRLAAATPPAPQLPPNGRPNGAVSAPAPTASAAVPPAPIQIAGPIAARARAPSAPPALRTRPASVAPPPSSVPSSNQPSANPSGPIRTHAVGVAPPPNHVPVVTLPSAPPPARVPQPARSPLGSGGHVHSSAASSGVRPPIPPPAMGYTPAPFDAPRPSRPSQPPPFDPVRSAVVQREFEQRASASVHNVAAAPPTRARPVVTVVLVVLAAALAAISVYFVLPLLT